MTGLGGRLTQAWEMAGINLHGLVMSVIGGKFVGYVTFDSVADANKAALDTGLFTSSLNAKVAVITGHNPNLKQLPLAPEPLPAAS